MSPGRNVGMLAGVVRALGGELLEGGRRALVPGPGHRRHDRSVSLLLEGDRVIAHSFAGDDWRAVLDELQARGLIDGENRILGGGSGVAPPKASVRERTDVARRLWEDARSLSGTLAERHLRGRAVGRSSDALRFHPSAPSAVYRGRGLRRPALLAAIRDPVGELVGVELTYLAADGWVARVPTPRKTVGARPAGAAVRLDPAGPELLVGEGVFTCLSASEALGLPAWALLAVGNLRVWTPPSGVERVVIAADRGAPGERGAAALRRRLRPLGIGAEVRLPPAGFGDWNDAARAAGEGEEAVEGGPGSGDRPPAGPGAPT